MNDRSDSPTLYVVDTPIGHLEDLTSRAKRVLKSVGLVVAEDTRRTRKLLSHLDTTVSLISFHEHSRSKKCEAVVEKIQGVPESALVSDAGSPVVSDPGGRLVRAVLEHPRDVDVVPVPGPSAVTAALATSGFPADRYRFMGYPPEEGAGRKQWLQSIRTAEETIVVFVAPHDLRDLFEDLEERMGDREAAAANELTKKHETVVRGTCAELLDRVDELNLNGEWTLVLGPGEQEESTQKPISIPDEELDLVLETGVKLSSGARILAGMRDLSRGEAYDLLQERKEEMES